jgi:hypothetical protein
MWLSETSTSSSATKKEPQYFLFIAETPNLLNLCLQKCSRAGGRVGEQLYIFKDGLPNYLINNE